MSKRRNINRKYASGIRQLLRQNDTRPERLPLHDYGVLEHFARKRQLDVDVRLHRHPVWWLRLAEPLF